MKTSLSPDTIDNVILLHNYLTSLQVERFNAGVRVEHIMTKQMFLQTIQIDAVFNMHVANKVRERKG